LPGNHIVLDRSIAESVDMCIAELYLKSCLKQRDIAIKYGTKSSDPKLQDTQLRNAIMYVKNLPQRPTDTSNIGEVYVIVYKSYRFLTLGILVGCSQNLLRMDASYY